MKSRPTLWLLLVVLLVGGLVWWDYHQGVSTDEAAARSKKIVQLDSADVTQVELVRSNQTILVEKEGDQWLIRQPLATRADFSAVSAIINELEFAERKRTISESELGHVALPDLGLASPSVVLKLASKDRTWSVKLGNETPTGEAVYLQVEGEPGVLVVDRRVGERLSKSLDQLRDRALFEFPPDSATRMQLKTSERVIELARPDGNWSLLQPLAARASQAKVGDLLRELGGLRVQDFVSDDPRDVVTYRLNEPVKEVTLWKDDKAEGVTLLIGHSPTNDTSTVYAKLKGSDSIVTIPQSSFESLALQPNDLRDTDVMPFDNVRVGDLRLLRGSDEIALVRTNGSWDITAPLRVAADPDQVQAVLRALRGLQVAEFVADVPTDLEKYGLAVPSLIVTLADDQGGSLAQLLVGSASTLTNPVRFVKLASEPFVYGVDPAAIDRLPLTAWSLRQRAVWELAPENIGQFAIETGDRRVVVARDADGQWSLVEPAEGVLDSDGLRQLIATFAALRAETFLPPVDEPLTPARVLTATVGDKTYRLVLAAPNDEGAVLAQSNDPALRFQLSEATVNTLSRDPVAVPPEPVQPN